MRPTVEKVRMKSSSWLQCSLPSNPTDLSTAQRRRMYFHYEIELSKVCHALHRKGKLNTIVLNSARLPMKNLVLSEKEFNTVFHRNNFVKRA